MQLSAFARGIRAHKRRVVTELGGTDLRSFFVIGAARLGWALHDIIDIEGPIKYLKGESRVTRSIQKCFVMETEVTVLMAIGGDQGKLVQGDGETICSHIQHG